MNPQTSQKMAFDAATGFLCGAASVIACQPFVYFKNLAQAPLIPEKTLPKSRSLNPLIWYRGTGVGIMSYSPGIALQMVICTRLAEATHPVFASLAAGAATSIVACPADIVMVQQQRHGLCFQKTVEMIHKVAGRKGFYRAVVPNTIRVSLFTTSSQ